MLLPYFYYVPDYLAGYCHYRREFNCLSLSLRECRTRPFPYQQSQERAKICVSPLSHNSELIERAIFSFRRAVFFKPALRLHLIPKQRDGLLGTAADTAVAHGTPVSRSSFPVSQGEIFRGAQRNAQSAAHAFFADFQLVRVSGRLAVKP